MLEEMLLCIALLPSGCQENKRCVLASLPDTSLEPHLSSSSIVNSILAYRWLSKEVLVIWVDVWNLAVYLPSSFGSVMLWVWAFLCQIHWLCTSVWVLHFCWFPCRPCLPRFHPVTAHERHSYDFVYYTQTQRAQRQCCKHVGMDFSCWVLGRIGCGLENFLLNYGEAGYFV